MALTTKNLRDIAPGQWKSDGGARGAGMLAFRRAASGEILAYFRHTLSNGKRDSLPLGRYDPEGRDGYTLAELREKSGEHSRLYQSGIRDLRAHFAAQLAEKEAANKVRDEELERLEREAEAAEKFTLLNLCRDYVKYQRERGKTESARQAESLFKVWVESDSDFCKTVANKVTSHQIAAAIRKPHEKGKIRTAGILRAYLLAAFNVARRAPFDSSLPSGLIAYEIESNPCEIIPAIPVSAGKRILTTAELKAYIGHLGETVIDSVLKVALYSGGQRISQLLRATTADFDENTLRLWDGKGRRREAREHLLPLAPLASALIAELIQRTRRAEAKRAELDNRSPNYSNLPIFSARSGEAIAPTSVGRRIQAISKSIGGQPFDIRDIRRTVETMMAKLGISKDLRAQLLSHGLGGVQDIHYDKHDYLNEKLAALMAWESHLQQTVAPPDISTQPSENPASEAEAQPAKPSAP